MKKLTVLFICISAIISFAGCHLQIEISGHETEAETVLNERQIEILREEDLPTDFGELTYTQQKAITAIETMLSYLDEKYDDEFAYAGYIAESVLEPEQLIAYKKGTSDFDCFTVTTTENGYEDNYIESAASPLFSEYIYDLVKGLCPNTEMRVYARITATDLTEIPAEKALFDGTTEGSILVFLDGQTCDEARYANVLAVFEQLMKEHKIYCSAQMIRTKNDVITDLTRYNYTDYLSEEYYSDRERIYVRK